MLFEAVEWAEDTLIHPSTNKPLVLWGNQTTALLETNPRKALVWARRTGKTTYLVVEALYYATHHGMFQFGDDRTQFRILVLNQTEAGQVEYFNELVRMADLSGIKVSRDVAHGDARTLTIVDDEGSKCDIFGITPNTKSSALCGIDADLIQVNDADQLEESAMTDIVLPILYTRPSVKLTLAATPTADKTTVFEQLSYRRDFSQLRATAHCRPDWAELQKQVKKEYKDDEWGYRHNVLAC